MFQFLGFTSANEDRQEQQKNFVSFARSKFSEHPMIHTMSDDDIVRFLISAKYRSDEAVKALEVTLNWREEFKFSEILNEDFSEVEAIKKFIVVPVTLCNQRSEGDSEDMTEKKPVERESSTNSVLTSNSSDECQLPTLAWIGSRHFPAKTTLSDTIRFIVYTIEKARSDGIITDKVNILIDRVGMTDANLDPPLMRALLYTMHNHYPERLHNIFLFPTSTLLTMGYQVVKNFLDPSIRNRVHLATDSEYKSVIQKHIPPRLLLQRHGGDVPDPESILDE
ncbi:CRAL-TRIO domain-containing protein [Cladochytrium replicatum]|nr:CRAL-TRIO domain-containing protein [Cladochytrium replicatum]